MMYWIWLASLWMSIIAFALFILTILKPKTYGGGDRDLRPQADDPLSKIVEAMAKLAEALSKSGPPALTIFAAVIFMTISLIAARG